MEVQSIGSVKRVTFGIELVPQNGVAKCQHMYAQLMRPASFWTEFNTGVWGLVPAKVGTVHYSPIGYGLFAILKIHHLFWSIGPITNKRQVDVALVTFKVPPSLCDICFFTVPVFKLKTQMSLCQFGFSHDENARCFHIQSVHQ